MQKYVSYLLIAGITFVYSMGLFLALAKVLPWMRDGMGYSTATLGVHAVCMNLVFFNGMSHYLLTVLTPPSPPLRSDYASPFAMTTDTSGESIDKRYYCRHCKLKREATTHHCSVCKTYVERLQDVVFISMGDYDNTMHCIHRCWLHMDHHCPFTRACIGQDNYANFYLFLMHSMIALVYAMVSSWPITHECLIQQSRRTACMELGGAMHLVLIPLSLLATMVAILMGFQSFLLSRNTSTYLFLKVMSFTHGLGPQRYGLLMQAWPCTMQESGDAVCIVPNYIIGWWNGPEEPSSAPICPTAPAPAPCIPETSGPTRAQLLLLDPMRKDPWMAVLPPVWKLWSMLRTKLKHL